MGNTIIKNIKILEKTMEIVNCKELLIKVNH